MAKTKPVRFTEEELDILCGEVRKYTMSCVDKKCGRTVGPYHNLGHAHAAMAEHLSWGHLRVLGERD